MARTLLVFQRHHATLYPLPTALQAAEADAASQLARAEAERAVVEKRTTARADVLRQEVAVYRDEADYVRARLYEKIAPNLEAVLTADRPDAPFGLPFKAAEQSDGRTVTRSHGRMLERLDASAQGK